MRLAEGLLMCLHKPDVVSLFEAISARIRESRIVCEVVTERYTQG